MSYTFLYPGQGSQSVGMGKDLVEAFEVARKRFNQADEILGRKLSSIILDGPVEQLTDTRNTQPALFTIEAAITDILAEKGIVPSFTAGHSLGEYSALYGAGVLSFEDGVAIVARRGELMAEAGQKAPGAMAAIIGMDRSKIIEILKEVQNGIVVPANENSPDQTVISGEKDAVATACEKIKAAGAKRALPLPVSGAFHSPLMQVAADLFAPSLDKITFNAPTCPVITNVTAKPETDPQVLKSLLLKQLVSPVRWVDSMNALASLGFGTILECGPGSVIKGLARKCNDALNVVPCDTATNIYSLLS